MADARSRALAVLRVVAGLAILAVVAGTLPWRDRLVLAGEGGEVAELAGTLAGDWTHEEVRFRPAPSEAPGPEWPAEVREAARTGASVAVRRGAPLAGAPAGLDWRPGLPRVFGQMDLGGLLAGLGWLAVVVVLLSERWRLLLGAVGCATGVFTALRLSLIGLFFSQIIPGTTGGDFVKGALVARDHRERRADAFLSAFVDRILGLLALAVVALVCILFVGGELAVLRLPIVAFLAVAVLGAALYASPAVRARVPVERVLERLPLSGVLRSVDEALLRYRGAPGTLALAFALAVLGHVAIVASCLAFGGAVARGAPDLEVGEYFVVVLIANLVGALPLAPGGWGVGEAAYRGLFELLGGSGTQGVAVSITFRLGFALFGLLGGALVALPGRTKGTFQLSENQ